MKGLLLGIILVVLAQTPMGERPYVGVKPHKFYEHVTKFIVWVDGDRKVVPIADVVKGTDEWMVLDLKPYKLPWGEHTIKVKAVNANGRSTVAVQTFIGGVPGSVQPGVN